MSASIFGNDVGIQHMKPDVIQLVHKGDFHLISGICACFGSDPTRRYFYVLENAYEQNKPLACELFCFYLPPNCCCPGMDRVRKEYFDRGIFDQQSCLWCCGYFNGAPSTHANQVKQVCCCQDCCECYNNYNECYYPGICGDRVRWLPSDNWCWCCPNRACWCHNCCSLCGPKNGEPLYLCPLVDCLRQGSAEGLVGAIQTSRESWKQRTGKP